MLFIVIHLKLYNICIYNTFKSVSSTYAGSISFGFVFSSFNCQTHTQSMKKEQTMCLVSSPTKNVCFYQYSQLWHILKHYQQCTGLLPMYSLSNALLTIYY